MMKGAPCSNGGRASLKTSENRATPSVAAIPRSGFVLGDIPAVRSHFICLPRMPNSPRPLPCSRGVIHTTADGGGSIFTLKNFLKNLDQLSAVSPWRLGCPCRPKRRTIRAFRHRKAKSLRSLPGRRTRPGLTQVRIARSIPIRPRSAKFSPAVAEAAGTTCRRRPRAHAKSMMASKSPRSRPT